MTTKTQKMICCILPKGVALGVSVRLKEAHNIVSSNISNARGVGKITPLAYRRIVGQSEKEILSVVIAAEIADDIFAFIYQEAEIDKPHGGIMYMHSLYRSTEYHLPEIADEK
jgi:hypothetical protein